MKLFGSQLSEVSKKPYGGLWSSLLLLMAVAGLPHEADGESSALVPPLRTEASWKYELSHRAVFGLPILEPPAGSFGVYSSLNLSRYEAAKSYIDTRTVLIRDTSPVPFVGVLNNGQDGLPEVLTTVFQQLHIQANLSSADQDLRGYRLLILGSVEDLTESDWPTVEAYVRNGGILLTSMSSGMVAKAMWEYWGDPLWQRTYSFFGFHVVGRALGGANGYLQLEPKVRKTAADRGCLIKGPFWEVLAPKSDRLGKLVLPWENLYYGFAYMQAPPDQVDVHPGVTSSPFGKGKVVFVTLPIFYALQSTAFPCTQDALLDLIEYLVPNPPFRTDAPPNLELNLMEKPGGLLMNLLYYSPNRPLTTRLDIEESLPLKNLSIEIRTPRPPAEVSLKPAGTHLEFEYREGYTRVVIPSVTDWQLLELAVK
jgi:hypothetical protein